MRLLPVYLLVLTLFMANNALGDYAYREDDTRMVNGILYDVNGDVVTGLYEEFYDDNVKKSEMPYVEGVLNGVGSLYNEKGIKKADMPFVNG